MEQTTNTTTFACLECASLGTTSTFGFRKTLGRHILTVHGLQYVDYLTKYNLSENVLTCHCGNVFENTRYPGGPRTHGRRQKYCSPECNAFANSCRRNYGIEPEVYWERAKNGCEICGSRDSMNGKRQLSVDHDHKTGKFRGVLCNECNTGIGNFRDSPELLQKAIEYLKRG